MNKLLKGGLAMAAGAVATEVLRRIVSYEPQPKYYPWERQPYREFPNRILIAGGGFAGYTVAKTLGELVEDRDDVGIMVISRENFFTYWPMVAGIISSDVETKNVAQPLRRALIQFGASFRRAELDNVEFEQQLVKTKGGLEFPYDHLVLALGADPAFFGIPGVEEHCISVKALTDAETIRNRMIERFEEFTLARDEEGSDEIPESKLTFVVIGGNATGVEVASELHALANKTLAPDYPNIDMNQVRIKLVDSNEEILKELDDALRRAARRHLEELGIEVTNNTRAQEVTADRVILDDDTEIETENVIWTAGNRSSVKVDELDLPLQGEMGIETDEYMRVPSRENVWAVGDCAANVDKDGEPVPPNAQAAVQEGHTLAKNILAVIDGREDELIPFEYEPMGQLVELGSQFAVNEVKGFKFRGLPAALFWRATYLFKLETPENRARIAADWFLDLFFHPSVTQIRGRGGA